MKIKPRTPSLLGTLQRIGAVSCAITLAACSQKPPADEASQSTGTDATGTQDTNTKPAPDTQPEDLPEPESTQGSTGSGQNTPDQTQPNTSTAPDSSSGSGTNSSDKSGEDNKLLGELPINLPKVTGTCPKFVNGQIEFNPATLKTKRKVRVWLSHESKAKKGPLVFYWHGETTASSEARMALGTTIRDITELGGIVVAPFSDPEAGDASWFLAKDSNKDKRMDDLLLTDEILACAIKNVGVDLRHIHAIGMSAGGLHTAQMSYLRSNYIASVASYSGGLIKDDLTMQEPNNQSSAMILHGGNSDVAQAKFKESSERYLQKLRRDGHFGFICDHGQGHQIARDASSHVWTFLQDHPFNVRPKPYQAALPKDFLEYCKLQ